MSFDPLFVQDSNLSVAWGRGFLESMKRGRGKFAPLTFVIAGFAEGFPDEEATIHDELDAKLAQLDKHSINETANTIFPESIWATSADRAELYERYRRMAPRLRKFPGNSYGTYFGRLVQWGFESDETGHGVNQLEAIIDSHESGVRRRTAFQATLLDPRRDLTRQRRRGFPCLEHVIFGYDDSGRVEVSAFYSTQYLISRAYGNLLGIARLGRFIADQFGTEMSKVTCTASFGLLETTKTSVQDLAVQVEAEIAA